MRTRAERRAERAKRVVRAAKIHPWCACPQKWADNLAKCSCSMCGNPRRHMKGNSALTLQERKRAAERDAKKGA